MRYTSFKAFLFGTTALVPVYGPAAQQPQVTFTATR